MMSEGNGFLTREAFLAPQKRRIRESEISGFGKIRIRSLTEAERANWEAPNLTKKGEINLSNVKDARLRAIVAALVDGDGNQMLSNADIGSLRGLDSGTVSEMYKDIAEHCGLDKDGVASAEKNSGPTAAGGSPSP
jgi:hypothetical protein